MRKIINKSLFVFLFVSFCVILPSSFVIALNIEYKQKNYYRHSKSEQKNLEQLQQDMINKINFLEQEILDSEDWGSKIALNHKLLLLKKNLSSINNPQNEKRFKISHIMMKHLNLGYKFHRETILDHSKFLSNRDIHSIFFVLANMKIMNFKIDPQVNIKLKTLSDLWLKPSIRIGWKRSLAKKFYNLNYQISGKLSWETNSYNKNFLNSNILTSETQIVNMENFRLQEVLYNSELILNKIPKYLTLRSAIFFSDWYIQYQYKHRFFEIHQINSHKLSFHKKISPIYVIFTLFSENNNKTKVWFSNAGMAFRVGLIF